MRERLNRVRERLTIFYINFFLGKFVEKRRVDYGGPSEEIYVYEGWDHGMAIPLLNEIAIERGTFTDYGEEEQRYLFLHELGHKRMEIGVKAVLYVSIIFAGLVAITSLFLLLFSPILQMSAGQVLDLFLVALFSTGSTVALSWLNEGRADHFVIDEVGINEYFKVKRRLSEEKEDLWIRIASLMVYPPSDIVVQFYQGYRLQPERA